MGRRLLPGRPGRRTPNGTDQTVRVLMFSTRNQPAASVYPDSGKIGIWTGNSDDDVMVEKSSGVGYWHGECPRRSGV